MVEEWFKGFVKKLQEDDPGMEVKASHDSMHDLTARTADGWLIIMGNPDFVEPIENAIYRPGTPKNADLEVMLMHHPFANHAWLAKKNDELASYLQDQLDLPVADVMNMQVVIYDPLDHFPVPPGTLYQVTDGTAVALAGARREDLEIFLYAYLKMTRY